MPAFACRPGILTEPCDTTQVSLSGCDFSCFNLAYTFFLAKFILRSYFFRDARASSADERLRITTSILKRMTQALVRVSGTLWSPKEIDVRLHTLIDLVNACPSRLAKWQESAAFEGARSGLAHLGAHRPDISTTEVATTAPEGCEPADFFEGVAELARQVGADCDLDKLME